MTLERQIFGHNLRALRQAKRMTLEDLHDATGIKVPYISEVERAKRNVGLDTASMLARAVGSDLPALLKAS